MTRNNWLYAWGLGSIAAGGASRLVPLYVVALGAGLSALGGGAVSPRLPGIVLTNGLLWFALLYRPKTVRPGRVYAATRMVTSAIVSLDTRDLVLNRTLEQVPDAQFESERIVKSGESSIMPLLWARQVDREPLEEAFERDPSVDEVELLEAFEDEYLYRMRWVEHIDILLQMLTNGQATILDAYARNDEWKLRVLYPDREKFSSTHEFCSEHGLRFEVEAVRQMESQPTGRYGLTEGQYEALVTAARRGYYDVPQEVTLEELADDLDISHQALSEQLRRGTEALVQDTLLIGAPPEFT